MTFLGEMTKLFHQEKFPSDSEVVMVAFFLECEDFVRTFDNSFPACAHFFFFKVKISLCILIPVFDHDHFDHDQSTVVERAETTVTGCFLTARV